MNNSALGGLLIIGGLLLIWLSITGRLAVFVAAAISPGDVTAS